MKPITLERALDAELLARVKAYVGDLRNEIDALKRDEHELQRLVTDKEAEFKFRRMDIQRRCPHVDTTYHPDASGNNDSGSKCNDCGVWL